MRGEANLATTSRPCLLLSLLDHLILVVLGLHLVPVVVDPQILNLQR